MDHLLLHCLMARRCGVLLFALLEWLGFFWDEWSSFCLDGAAGLGSILRMFGI